MTYGNNVLTRGFGKMAKAGKGAVKKR